VADSVTDSATMSGGAASPGGTVSYKVYNGTGCDNNGNPTTDDTGKSLLYDAWNRLVRVDASLGGAHLAAYAYDAIGRRIQETHYSPSATTTDLYFSSQWQVLEEQQSGAMTASASLWLSTPGGPSRSVMQSIPDPPMIRSGVIASSIAHVTASVAFGLITRMRSGIGLPCSSLCRTD